MTRYSASSGPPIVCPTTLDLSISVIQHRLQLTECHHAGVTDLDLLPCMFGRLVRGFISVDIDQFSLSWKSFKSIILLAELS